MGHVTVLRLCALTRCVADVVNQVISNIEATCKTRNLGCAIQRKVRLLRAQLLSRPPSLTPVCLQHDAGAMECSPALRESLETAAGAVNAKHAEEPLPVPVLVSGAGHDGLAIADFCPVSMLFVRCRGGVSHSPDEFVSRADVGAAVDALVNFLRAEA